MSAYLGIILAIVAMLFWGIGDFLIQRSTRSIGNWETLFIITAFGSIVLLPFVWNDLPTLFQNSSSILFALTFSGVIILIAAIIEFESLRIGKLAVVEPIMSLEIPTAAILAFAIIDEHLTVAQIILIGLLIFGLICVSFKGGRVTIKHFLEKGALVAAGGAISMGLANFFMGFSGRISNSLLTNFISCVVMAVASYIYLASQGKVKHMVADIKKYPRMLFTMSLFDNIAWVAFVAAMTMAPIGVVVALTESYIIIVVLLGLLVNKEKLIYRQKVGLVIALVAAIVLAVVTG